MATREVAATLGVSPSQATHLLRSLERAGLVRRLRHGVWILRLDVDRFEVPPYLTAPLPAYVSFWSALAHHEMIEQVPRIVYVASLDRSKRVVTALGTYSIHHLMPQLFGGYIHSDDGFVATPEKALFDSAYLAASRGAVSLPEVESPEDLDVASIQEWVGRINSPRIKSLVSLGLDRILHPDQVG